MAFLRLPGPVSGRVDSTEPAARRRARIELHEGDPHRPGVDAGWGGLVEVPEFISKSHLGAELLSRPRPGGILGFDPPRQPGLRDSIISHLVASPAFTNGRSCPKIDTIP